MAFAHKYEYVTNSSRLPAIAEEVAASPLISLDLETTGFSPFTSKIRLLSLNTGKNVYVIDAFKCGTLKPVTTALGDSKGIKVGQNLKFDQKFLIFHEGIELWPVFDTFRASALVHNGRKMGHNLYDLYDRELHKGPETPDLGGSDWSQWDLTQDQLDYAAEDVVFLPPLREALKPKLAALGLNKIALIEFGVLLPEGAVELNGFNLSAPDWKSLYNENFIRMKMLETLLLGALPSPTQQMTLPGLTETWNLGSTKQMLASLRKLGMDIENTAEMTLAMQVEKHPIVSKVLDFREAETQVSSFGSDFLKNIDPLTTRIHANYFAFLKSGRYACQSPNLAQIPRLKQFRKCFKAPQGYKLLLSDYSNIEMRIVAEISGDEVLIRVFVDGKDAHRFTASILTGKAESAIDKQERQQAKPVNFGFIYGMQPPKLVLYARANYGVALTEKQATDFRNKYFERFAGLSRWHRMAQRDGQRTRAAWSIGGRLRWLDDPNMFNEFYNHPVQSTGADGLKASLREVYFRLKAMNQGVAPVRTATNSTPNVMMVHHVHDEIILQVKDDEALLKGSEKALTDGMKAGMQQFLKKVPVDAEASTGDTWADKA